MKYKVDTDIKILTSVSYRYTLFEPIMFDTKFKHDNSFLSFKNLTYF